MKFDHGQSHCCADGLSPFVLLAKARARVMAAAPLGASFRLSAYVLLAGFALAKRFDCNFYCGQVFVDLAFDK